jgi:glycosyltransferase involved in cell wall biosynthesis/MoaA/NifB/PqqE/SkfB family radical SAM enzyme
MENYNTPKVSVIVPVYNSELYLHRCIASLIFQTLRDIEIICINDGSTDNSPAILEEFAQKDSRVVIINQQNEGCANARNKGLAAAKAPYIGFVDSDDFIAPEMYETLYNAMIQNDIDLVCCGSYLTAMPLTPEWIINDQIKTYEIRCDGKTSSKEVFFSHNHALWNKLFKKELIEKHRISFDRGFASYEDSKFVWSYWCIAKSAYFIRGKFYYYLLRDNGIMGKSFRRQMGGRGIDKIKVCHNFYDFLMEFNIFAENKYFFWKCYVESIYCARNWGDPETYREQGIPLITGFLKGKDLSYLPKDEYWLLHCFAEIGENETTTLREHRLLCFKQRETWHINDLSVTKQLYFFNVQVPDSHSRFFHTVYRRFKTYGAPKTLIKKVIKCLLPYGLVKIMQKARVYWFIIPNGLVKIIQKARMYWFTIPRFPPDKLPSKVWLEASTICQLNCSDCYMRKRNSGILGAGYLKFEDFKKFIDRHPFVKSVELSNNGEIFMNPELLDIIKYGYEKGITLTAGNGVNFNTVSEEMLEALVKYRFKYINFSIDGASQETYSIYRRNGDFDKVIANIKRLNEYKRSYKSELPVLHWQFVLMNHNQDDVLMAKKLAKELGMKIGFMLTWTPGFKAKQPEMLRRETGRTYLSQKEYNENNKNEYMTHEHCRMLWKEPTINYDGGLIGCCRACNNDDNNFGIDVFKVGLKRALKNKKYMYAKKMLLGKVPSPPPFLAPYIPCAACSVYERMKDSGLFLDKKRVKDDE